MEFFAVTLAVIIIFLWFVLHGARTPDEKRKQIIGVNHAHRGLHTQDKTVPENSLAAFRAAVQNGYGIELDLQLSKDGHVVVFHDDTLDRVCGQSGKVNSFTLEELQKMRLCETSETIPLFTEVLSVVAGKTNIIVELKSIDKNDELCEKTLALLREYSGPYCIESFNPKIVAWFRKNAPDIIRGQLTSHPSLFVGVKWHLRVAVGCVLTNVIARPHFIAHGTEKKSLFVRMAEMTGVMRVCWTVTDETDAKKRERENDAIIFEFYTPNQNYML